MQVTNCVDVVYLFVQRKKKEGRIREEVLNAVLAITAICQKNLLCVCVYICLYVHVRERTHTHSLSKKSKEEEEEQDEEGRKEGSCCIRED